MTIERKLLGTTPVSGEVLPEAVSLDGTNDYLSRSSDLTGNADGKTFTFSCWFYYVGDTLYLYQASDGTAFKVDLTVNNSERLSINLRDSSGNTILGTYNTSSPGPVPENTYSHV